MYTALQVANSVLKLSFDEEKWISPLKLQKLVYLVHGWHLACFDKPAIEHEPEAWHYGPVFPEIYHEYKIFGSLPISQENWELYGTANRGEVPKKDENFHQLLKQVWALYSPYSGLYLSNLTHKSDTPWSSAKKKGNNSLNQKDIKQHFKQLMSG